VRINIEEIKEDKLKKQPTFESEDVYEQIFDDI
jgi:hypothetical protein